jgi:hypothetical protein
MAVLRIVWGRVESARFPALADAFRDASTEGPKPDGLVAWHLGTRPSAAARAVAGLTVWESADQALVALGSGLASSRTLGGLGGAAEFSRADFYEIDAARVHPVRGDPAFLRVATGLLAGPSTSEMLGEMRQRLPLVGPEMVEAYIGRRLVAAGVEIAFVSIWENLPDVRQLEMPLWPDLARRKESFAVQTFFATHGGIAGAGHPMVANLGELLGSG